jgi:hypothetical protein
MPPRTDSDSQRRSRQEEARAAARSLVDLIETNASADQCLLVALRLARLQRDEEARLWLQLELRGYAGWGDLPALGRCEKYARAGRVNAKGALWTLSLPEAEAQVRACEAALTAVKTHGPIPIAENHTAKSATAELLGQLQQYQTGRGTALKDAVARLSALRVGLHAYATESLIALEFSELAQDVVGRARERVDVFVRAHAPAAAESLVAITDRLREGTTEAHAQALVSCRRLLKTVADTVFPPQAALRKDARGKERKVGEEEYKNRILAFFEDRLSGSTRDIAVAEVEHLAARVDAVYEKNCKGVHTNVTAHEAELATIHTYLIIAEIARAAEEVPPSDPAV